MIIDINSLPEGHSTLSKDCELESVRAELPPFTVVQCEAQIDRHGAEVYVHVQFSGDFELECSRCLEKFRNRVEGDLRLIIKEQAGRHGPSLDDDTTDFYYDARNYEVDISPAVFDEIMIALPLMPLCAPDCKGIETADSAVKVDLSATEPQKKAEDIDPRWEVLRKLKNKR